MNVVAPEVPVAVSVVAAAASVVAQEVPAVSVAAQVVPAASVAARVEIVEVIVLTTKNHVAT